MPKIKTLKTVLANSASYPLFLQKNLIAYSTIRVFSNENYTFILLPQQLLSRMKPNLW